MLENVITMGSLVQAHMVRDDEGWINVAAFNALQQWTQVAMHMCLSHSKRQAFREGSPKG